MNDIEFITQELQNGSYPVKVINIVPFSVEEDLYYKVTYRDGVTVRQTEVFIQDGDVVIVPE